MIRKAYVVVAILVVAFVWVSYQVKRSEMKTPEPERNAQSPEVVSTGKKAPDFTLKSLTGESVSLSQFKGKNVVLLDFWATWCPPCRAAMPELAALHAKYGARGLKVISVNQSEDNATVQSFVTEIKYTPLVILDDGSVGNKYGVRAIPTLVLIDKAGMIRHSQSGFGPGMGDDLARRIEELLGPGPTAEGGRSK